MEWQNDVDLLDTDPQHCCGHPYLLHVQSVRPITSATVLSAFTFLMVLLLTPSPIACAVLCTVNNIQACCPPCSQPPSSTFSLLQLHIQYMYVLYSTHVHSLICNYFDRNALHNHLLPSCPICRPTLTYLLYVVEAVNLCQISTDFMK